MNPSLVKELQAFRSFVDARMFPCVGAKAAVGRGQLRLSLARDIRSNWDDLEIGRRLTAFARDYARDPRLFSTFVVVFRSSELLTEVAFERALWARLQSLSDKDTLFGGKPDPRIATDPADASFGVSFGGQAFFVVGLHPGSSRPARRYRKAALVFNPHDQFIRLRAANKYETMRETIVARDIALAGSANPMLARHGEMSEARQYSGRAVGEDWKCPFARRNYAWDKLADGK